MKQPWMRRIRRIVAPKSLRYQLLSRTLLLLAALLLLIGVLQYVLMKDFVYENKANTINAQLMSMPMDWFGASVSKQDNRDGKGNVLRNDSPRQRPQAPVFYQPGMSFAFVDNDGDVEDLTEDSELASPQLSKQQYTDIMAELVNSDSISYRIVSDDSGHEQLVVFRLVGSSKRMAGLIQGGAETASLQKLLLTQLAIFISLAVLALAAGLSLYLPLLRKTLTPLSRVVRAASDTDAGNLNIRLPVQQGQLEIDRLSEAFNGMLARLESSFEAERRTTERMRRFIADASHELRTPLTSIHGFIEVLQRGAAANPEQLNRALASMGLESQRINKLVADLLTLAKLDQAPELVLSPVRLDEVLREMEPQLHLLAGNRSVQIELTAEVTGHFHADKLKQVVLNLFLNAVQHTGPESGSITLTLGVSGNKALLNVTDNGTGIAAEHIPHLFERFYRNESSRTRKSGGAGLGLAITKSLVEAHNGSIDVSSEPGVGSQFRVLLPLG
ncbi:two-component system OmpR family sensor kinase [Paenibacillus harenae]|nr:two-component system OmpR family sensor kinase [Paenibacillus harenae]